jgi:tetratricopeptide (TPR) repeat protein
MNQNETNLSPLKLYRQAYTLHYTDGNIETACEIYEQLIRQFPDSNESAYAAVQLNKIKSGEFGKAVGRRGRMPLTLLLLLSINLAATITLIVLTIVSLYTARTRDDRNTYISLALAKMSAGKYDDALDILKIAKINSPKEIVPFSIASEMYRKNNEFINARKEYETYLRLNSSNPFVELELGKINEEEDTYIRSSLKEAPKTGQLPEDVVQEDDRESLTREREIKAQQKTSRPAKKKPKLLVPENTINYF